MADEETREPQGQSQENPTASQEQPASQQGEQSEEGWLGIMSPEGFMMMLIAGTIDSVGIILLCFGLDDFGVTDFIAYSTIGTWMLMRGTGLKKPQSAAGVGQAAEKATKIAKRLKWLRPLAFIGELIPYVGAAPLWTILVYTELKS